MIHFGEVQDCDSCFQSSLLGLIRWCRLSIENFNLTKHFYVEFDWIHFEILGFSIIYTTATIDIKDVRLSEFSLSSAKKFYKKLYL